MWLAELHFNPTRSVLSAPVVVGSSIATRTKRLRLGMAVHVLPLSNPLRIAEEIATLDQISEGRFEFGVGRSGFARSYDIYGVPYVESQERFREALDIILEAWKGEPFSYEGEFYTFDGATVWPRPYQMPHPPLRIAANTAETFTRLGQQGHPIFVGLRGMDIPELQDTSRNTADRGGRRATMATATFRCAFPCMPPTPKRRRWPSPGRASTPISTAWGRCCATPPPPAPTPTPPCARAGPTVLPPCPTRKMLETKVAFGTGEGLIDRFTELKEELGLDGIVAELNAGGLIPEEGVTRSVRIITEQVMPAFK